MAVTVQLTWTNPSQNPIDQTVQMDVGAGFTDYTYVAIDPEHVAGVTVYTCEVTPGLAEKGEVKFRVITKGVTGATVTGNEITLEVPGDQDILAISDLSGTVVVTA